MTLRAALDSEAIPNSESRKKPEIRIPKPRIRRERSQPSGFPVSDLLRISDFGFGNSIPHTSIAMLSARTARVILCSASRLKSGVAV